PWNRDLPMSEQLLQAAGDEGSGIRIRAQRESSARIQAITEPASQNQVPALARSMCSPLVRVADQVALILAGIFSLFSASIQRGETFEHYLGLRISMRNLLLQIGLLIVWRFLFWVVGTYQPRLNPNMTTMLWRIPLTTALCAGVFCPLLLWARPGNEALDSCLLFWLISTSLMLL